MNRTPNICLINANLNNLCTFYMKYNALLFCKFKFSVITTNETVMIMIISYFFLRSECFLKLKQFLTFSLFNVSIRNIPTTLKFGY